MSGKARRTVHLAVPALLLAVLIPTGSVQAQPAPAASKVHDCHTWASYPNVLISSARNMTCRKAKKEMRRYHGSIARTFETPGGFACKRVSGGPLSGQWRCTHKQRAFRFDFGD